MNNQFSAKMIVLCEFDLKREKLLQKFNNRIITKLKEHGSEIIEKVENVFCNKKFQEIVNKEFYPEIWKERFVLIIHVNPKMKSAIVLPLTSKEPKGKEKENTMFLPIDKKPQLLAAKDSWVIYDMPCYVNTKRLKNPQYSGKPANAFLDKEIYKEVIQKYKAIIADA